MNYRPPRASRSDCLLGDERLSAVVGWKIIMTQQSRRSIESRNSRTEAGRVMKKISEYCSADADLKQRYAQARQVVRAFRVPAFYEVSTRCNLLCEGCYFFESSDAETRTMDPGASVESWRAFFESEANRGVTMAYLVGAEPALHQDRLKAAAGLFDYAQIGTNGTVYIDPEIRYRVTISVWATDEATDRKLRGASTFRKALKLYENDPRVIFLFTVTAQNIDEILPAAQLCSEHGVELTFNFYSPTHQFNSRLDQSADHDGQYFRWSDKDDSPTLSDAALMKSRDAIFEAMARYPETVVYSHSMCERVTQPGSLYEINANGIAEQCGALIGGNLRYFDIGRQSLPKKCCVPDVDCRTCRIYSGSWATRLSPRMNDVADARAFSAWVEDVLTVGHIFLGRAPSRRTDATVPHQRKVGSNKAASALVA